MQQKGRSKLSFFWNHWHAKVYFSFEIDRFIILIVNLLSFLSVDHLSLLALHLLISKNKLRLAIGIQDVVGVGGGGEQGSVLHPGKGEAGAAGLASGGESQGEKGEEEAEDTEGNTK